MPILLHIGAIEDYAEVEHIIEEMGMKLLVNENEHINCSTIEKWYPILKARTPFTKIYDELPDVDVMLISMKHLEKSGNKIEYSHGRRLLLESM